MILRDGHLGPQHYPSDQPTLRTPPKAGPVVDPPSVLTDRLWWVTVARPMLIAAGNLIETDEMRAEAKRLAVKAKPAVVVPVASDEDGDGEVPF